MIPLKLYFFFCQLQLMTLDYIHAPFTMLHAPCIMHHAYLDQIKILIIFIINSYLTRNDIYFNTFIFFWNIIS